MQVSDFHFDLPDELIARYPMAERTASRLMEMRTRDYLAEAHRTE